MKAGPRVLHISSNRGWGGGENQVRLLMRELAHANIPQLCIAPADSPLAQRLTYLNFPVKRVKWSTGSDPRALIAIMRTIRTFDIVHCHDAVALQLAILPATLFGVPVVASRRMLFKPSALKWNRARVVIAISESVRAKLIEAGVRPSRIRVIYSGTDRAEGRAVSPLRPSLRSRFGIPAGAFVVGNAAALFPIKGQAIIPEAAALMPDVHWLIAGEGPARKEIEAAIAANDVGDRVHLAGWLEDARAMLKEVDAYVSTSPNEALGNSVIEAIALQIPVAAVNTGGPAEVIAAVHEQTQCVLFESGDAQALAHRITKLRDGAVRRQVIAAQDTRFEDFTIQRTAKATLALYREVLAT